MIYKKIPYKSGLQILNRFKASEDAVALITEDMSAPESIESLKQAELNFDLIQFLAHGLPVRESIWWASLCLDMRSDVWSPIQMQCVNTARDWVKSPSEELRRKAELFANRLEQNCGPSWLAQAVFWNGSGSIVAADLPVVLPDAHLYSKAVSGAVNHAAALPHWDGTKEYYEKAISTALDIAAGGNGKEVEA
ncbi:hypothetical protein M9194_17090 [Vibrio sp. S4M6]|uniref:DUF6931 family protein n=1 Tax=Vibrio sinus TaxID=2946865 RepID=UPI00202A3984|nr:hypothetical protein [Vibrio sinus]MCL9783146.1 hypothetical protein [Vibrio sinus]